MPLGVSFELQVAKHDDRKSLYSGTGPMAWHSALSFATSAGVPRPLATLRYNCMSKPGGATAPDDVLVVLVVAGGAVA